ncbi:MAG TPA: hypothetical protein VJV78_37895 [Polyangiales bacterium]|nr:hypothetical protein [Polyangiales bacterium]
MSGLLAAGAAGCGGSTTKDSKPAQTKLDDEELDAVCQDRVDDALKATGGKQDVEKPAAPTCTDEVKTAEARCDDKVKAAKMQIEAEKPDTAKVCSDVVKTAEDKCKPFTATSEEKTSNSEQKNYSFAELTKRCDERGGYVQIHGACGSVGTCAGFSFGDWGPDAAVLTEHSCSGSNGCLGLSCVVLPKDQGRSGEKLYEQKYDEPGPGSCTGCHAVHNDDDTVDASKFYVYVMPGSTRTEANWLDRKAEEQERIVAFGVHGTLPSGLAYNTMSPYFKLLSRAEISRVVEHLRKLTPIVKEIKLADPMAK